MIFSFPHFFSVERLRFTCERTRRFGGLARRLAPQAA
jgi:hypothetical protein